MGGRPLSETKKKQILREAEDALRARALEAYRTELAKPAGVKQRSARKIAADFICIFKQETGRDIKLDHSYLCRKVHSAGRTRSEANAARSWLTDEECEVVINYVVECGNRGFPLSHRRLREHVNEILRARLGDKFPVEGVGKKWSHRFIEKYSSCLKTSWSTPLDSKRGRAVNEHTIKAFYDLVEHVTEKYDIQPENIYGTDEIGTNPANGEKERVIGGKKNGPQYQQRDGNRENITVIVTICADGTTTPPAVIFKGQAFQVKWQQDNPVNAS